MTDYSNMKKTYYNQAGVISSFEETPDGGLLIHGVTIMAAGTWTDMHGITTTFSEDVLQRCASAWDDTAVWTRHAGGAPRSVTEKVGTVLNPRYSPTDAAVIGDVLIHRRTDTSAACAALVQMQREAGGIKDVSAETMVEMDNQGNVLDMVFTGLALVEDGACETCRIPAFGKEDSNMADDEQTKQEEVEVKTEETETEAPAEGQATAGNDDLLDTLAKFVGAIIPDSAGLIEAVRASEGDERIRALGRLEGCMSAWGVPTVDEELSKMIDDRLAEFSKTLDDRLAQVQTTQYGKPDGLKGRAGADKQTEDRPQSLVMFGRGVPRY